MHTFHEPPSLWVKRHATAIPAGGSVLDLACGHGRNARWLAERGWQVLAVDRDADALASLADCRGITTLLADLEGASWPFAVCEFDAVVVCRYLHRPLLPQIAASLADGGLLIYETFMAGQETIGRPRNPDFLLQPDELLQFFSGSLQILAFEQGLMSDPAPSFLQRISARRQI